ncbi:hypothetical protein PPTG_24359 [Phytophthora nicotianae INRA-310]|uniref:Uncharacterized protein n=1 Tax=Phytophthora nicotianae (strain INRA-310) TaxID=761204 RepID=W2PI43_PHYN3|nr:hypothetical protein PPTG_24359 [Phytophthora nicotianae INRA-310]ETM99888.1 hypothetical protein PPTG_24359 [Phytophthora nicotianae INRA-310]
MVLQRLQYPTAPHNGKSFNGGIVCRSIYFLLEGDMVLSAAESPFPAPPRCVITILGEVG